jgi:glycosyltransferase involved in cell wall biosynthesis
LPSSMGWFSLQRDAAILRRYLAGRPFDLIHTHYRRATLLARRIAAGRPILYTLHLSHINIGGWRRWLTDFADHTHIASEDARHWLNTEGRIADAHITCIPHGIDLPRWPITTPEQRRTARESLGIPLAARVMLFVGRLDEPKNVDWVLSAHENAMETLPDVHTLIVGDGPHREWLAGSIEMGVRQFHLLGERDPLQAYQAADLFVLPSEREGFSYVCAEALATGLPILRTRTTGTSETVVEGVTGRSVPIEQPAFEKAVIQMLGDPEGLMRMRPACSAFAHERLSFDLQVAKTLDLYRRLAKLGRPA